jgi:hypothetical protein
LGQRLSDLERESEEPSEEQLERQVEMESEEPSEEQSHLVDEMEVIREAIRSHPRCPASAIPSGR